MKNNKGFSLVELIIVIAIMAILVGVMAPQLIKYIEKTNVSSDTQLCDSIKTAITTAMMDPSVISSSNAGIPTNSGMQAFTSFPAGDCKTAVEEILGFSIADAEKHLKSTYNTTKTSSKTKFSSYFLFVSGPGIYSEGSVRISCPLPADHYKVTPSLKMAKLRLLNASLAGLASPEAIFKT